MSLEPVLLEEERHEDAVNHQYEVVGVNTVEHVVAEHQRDFALHTVRLTYPAYLVDFFCSYHFLI